MIIFRYDQLTVITLQKLYNPTINFSTLCMRVFQNILKLLTANNYSNVRFKRTRMRSLVKFGIKNWVIKIESADDFTKKTNAQTSKMKKFELF